MSNVKIILMIIVFFSNIQTVLSQNLSFQSINSHTSISITEVTNEDYELFLNETRNQSNLQTNIYQEEWGNLEKPITMYKLFYTAMLPEHPVVNISQERAKAYCRWLTNKYKKGQHSDSNRVIIRLPTEKEWKVTAQKYKADIDSYDSIYQIKMFEPDSVMEANNWSIKKINPEELSSPNSKHKEMTDYIESDDYEKRYLICRSEFPATNKTQLKHMNSNVSEWLAEKDKAIGVNWLDTKMARNETKPLPKTTTAFHANFPSPKIGFRVVKVVIEE